MKTTAKVQKRIDEVLKTNKENEHKIEHKSECESALVVVDTPMEESEKPQDQLLRSARKTKKEKLPAPEAPKKEEILLPEKVSQNQLCFSKVLSDKCI